MANLNRLSSFEDLALLLLRLLVGGFLIWGVWDNLFSAARMDEFVGFLRGNGFPWPEWMARLSVWVQFVCGVAFVTGLLIRWAGLLCAINFVVAIVMVDATLGIRASFPAAMLVALGLYFTTRGAGAFALGGVARHRGL